MKLGIDIYASRETLDATDLSGHRVNEIEAGKQFSIGSFTIKPFSAVHDVACLGFLLLSDNGTRLIFLTDSQFVPYRFEGSAQIIAIECNYSMDTLKENLKNGLDPEAAKRTIRGHMSLETAKGFFRANDMSKVEQIHLLHLSAGNSDAKRFKKEIMRITGKPVYVSVE